jgi:hypothetical protein
MLLFLSFLQIMNFKKQIKIPTKKSFFLKILKKI